MPENCIKRAALHTKTDCYIYWPNTDKLDLTYDLYFILEYFALEHDHIYMFFIFIQSFINLSLSMHILAKTRNIYVSISPIYCHLLIFLTSLWIFRLWQVPSLSRPRYRPIHFRQHIH